MKLNYGYAEQEAGKLAEMFASWDEDKADGMIEKNAIGYFFTPSLYGINDEIFLGKDKIQAFDEYCSVIDGINAEY